MVNFFRKIFPKKIESSAQPKYLHPEIDCSSLILLSGPAYGDSTFFGSFLLNSVAVREWASDHSKSVWSSAKSEQQARLYLPIWLKKVSPEDDGYVTLLDVHMRHVLVPYIFDFYLKGWMVVYCHQCSTQYDTWIDNDHNHQKAGHTRQWTEEWLCPIGHILHYKEQEIRLIIKKAK